VPFDTIENAKIGGLGISLAKKFSRAIDYEHRPASDDFCDLTGVDAPGGLNRLTVTFIK